MPIKGRMLPTVPPLVLLVLAVVVLGPHVRDGGFLWDDWYLSADATLTSFGHAVHDQVVADPRRPLAALYFAAINSLVGGHQHVYMALLVAFHLAMVLVFYAVLRELRCSYVLAGGAAVLALLFPFSDATWLWGTASQISLCVLLWLCGLLVGLRATRGAGRWHVLALLLYAASVLLYELTLPVVVLGGALYLVRGERRTALRAWASDGALAVVLFTLFTSEIVHVIPGNDQHTQSAGGTLHHVGAMIHAALTLSASAAVPLGAPGHKSDAVAAAVASGGALVAWRTKRAWLRADLRRWLALAAGAAVVIGAGYVMLARGTYLPLDPGLGNRINVIAGLGYSLLAVSLICIAATLIFSVLEPYRRFAPMLAGVMIAAVTVAYIHHGVNDRRTWDNAVRDGRRVLAVIHQTIRHPPRASLVLASGFSEWEAPQVPIFARYGDLTGAVELLWRDPSLTGVPIDARTVHGRVVTCSRTGVRLSGVNGDRTYFFRYSRVLLVDVATRQAQNIVTQSSCQRAR